MAKSLLITEDYPPMIGGIATFLQSLKAFSNNRLILLTTVPRSTAQRETDVFRVKALRGLGFLTLFIATLILVLRHRPRFIVWGQVSWIAVIGWLWSCILRIPLVIMVHGYDLPSSLASGWPRRRLCLFALHQCQLILANSHHTASKIMDIGIPPEKVKVLHPGVDTRFFKPVNNSGGLHSGILASQHPVLLSVARLVEVKNHEAVLRAVGGVRSEFPGIMYLIAGDGPRRPLLQKLVQDLGLAEHVRFLGFCSPQSLLNLYNLANVFVLLSRELRSEDRGEAFGIVFAEAAACGKPVVAGDSGGAREAMVHGVTGLLVNPVDDEAIKNAILQILRDPALAKKMGQAGRRWAEEELAWEKVAQRFDQELANLSA